MVDLPATVDELPQSNSPRSRRFELTLAILLGLAAIATGYSAYQADLDRGDSLRQFQVANRLTAESIDFKGQADVQRSIDQQLFVEYLKATQAGNFELAQYLGAGLSPDLRNALDEWSAGPDTGISPFAGNDPVYVQPLYDQGDQLAQDAEVEFAKADDLRRSADGFTLIGVLLASALFLYGIAAVSRARKVRLGLTGVGFAIYVGAVLALIGMSV
jgi:hypothetical protein